MSYFSLTHDDYLILDMLYIKLSWNVFLLTNIESVLLWYCITQFLKQSKNFINFYFNQQKIFRHQIPHNPTQKALKDGAILGSSDIGELYLDSDVNHLASGKLRQFTTVPNQCERLPYPWTWSILYFDCWYNFENCPGIVWSVSCKKLSLHRGILLHLMS